MTELRLKKRELAGQLSELNREITRALGTARKRRYNLRKQREIQKEINLIDSRIAEERVKFQIQKNKLTSNMFKTPPKHILDSKNDPLDDKSADIVEDVPNLANKTVTIELDEDEIEPLPVISEQPTKTLVSSAPVGAAASIANRDTSAAMQMLRAPPDATRIQGAEGGAIRKFFSLKPPKPPQGVDKMEEKVESLQKELDQTKGYYTNMLKNNLLVPTNNKHPKNVENVRRSLDFNFDFELKKPVPRDRGDPPKGDTFSIVSDLLKPYRPMDENPGARQISLPPTTKPVGNPIPHFEKMAIDAQLPNIGEKTKQLNESGVRAARTECPPQAHNVHSNFHPQQTRESVPNIVVQQPHISQNNPNPQQAHDLTVNIQTPLNKQQEQTFADNFERPNNPPQNNFEQQANVPQQNLLGQVQMDSPNLNYRHDQRDLAEARPRSSFIRRLKSIPKLTGETHNELREFIDVVDTLFVCIQSRNEEAEFYDQLLLQIRGEARNAIERLERTDWQLIREKLKTYFSYLANKDIINSKIENLKQEKDESLNQFIERTRKMLQEKNSIYGNLSEDQKNEHNKMARRAFARGVKDARLRERLQINGANTLEDAIAYSIETENYITNQISDRETYCGYCKNTGHRERNCFRKEQGSGPISNLISALRSMNGRPNGNRNNTPNFNFSPNNRNNGGNRNNNRGWNNGGRNGNGLNFNQGTDRNGNRNWNGNRDWNNGNRNNDRNTNSNWNNGNRNNRNIERDNNNEPNRQNAPRNDGQTQGPSNKKRENNRNFSNFPIETAVTVKKSQSSPPSESSSSSQSEN